VAPWQTYPGHPECPVPGPPGIPSQWDHGQLALRDVDGRAGLTIRLLRQLFSRRFPGGVLGRGRLLSALSLSMLGLRDTRHALRFAEKMHRLSQMCDDAPPSMSVAVEDPMADQGRAPIPSRRRNAAPSRAPRPAL